MSTQIPGEVSVEKDAATIQAMGEATTRALGGEALAPGCEIVYMHTIPYSGSEPLMEATIRKQEAEIPNLP